MTSLEIFAFFVMPGLTVLMAALGYLVVRLAIRAPADHASKWAGLPWRLGATRSKRF